MPEPLLGQQQYVADWDADTDVLRITGTIPGPAGLHELILDRVSVALDAADVAVVNFVQLEHASNLTADSDTARLLVRLVGADSAAAAMDVVGRADEYPTRLGPRLDPDNLQRNIDRDLVRAVIAASTAESAGLTGDEQALAELEALTLLHRLHLDPHTPGFDARLHDACAHLAESRLDALLDPWGPLNGNSRFDVATVAAGICEQAAGLLTDRLLATRLNRVASRIREGSGVMIAASMPEPEPILLAGAAAPAAKAGPVTTLDSLPNLLASQQPTIRRTSNDEYEVRLPDWAARADGWWVRSLRGNDNLPLAVVPITADDNDAVARFLITPRATELVIDIVGDPAEPRSSEQIATFRAAIETGKHAARLERLLRGDDAERAWRRSSNLHKQAGDTTRSKMALSRSSDFGMMLRGRGLPLPQPVIADLLAPNA